jgi:hypothetical protein
MITTRQVFVSPGGRQEVFLCDKVCIKNYPSNFRSLFSTSTNYFNLENSISASNLLTE